MFYRCLLIFGFLFSLNSAFALEQLPYKRLRFDLNFLLNFSYFKNSSIALDFNGKNPKIPSFAGLGLSLEPKYSLTKNWSLGLLIGVKSRLNPLNNMEVFHKKSPIGKVSFSAIDLLSQYQFTSDFHLRASQKIRPYLGLGIGLGVNKPLTIPQLRDLNPVLNIFGVLKNDGNIAIGYINKDNFNAKYFFILSPRIGIDLWHIRFNLVYDFVVNTKKQLEFKGTIFNKEAINQLSNNINQLFSEVTGIRPSYSNLTGQIIFYFGGGKHKKKKEIKDDNQEIQDNQK